ncbi:MAG: Omp28-related outer membrane protein [Sphingobacteriales bacterium]|nr:MAG: Omp28-related outer membrane protein [Sphingobacteriales bacterium]
MKKGLLYASMACVLGLGACEEKGPAIDFGGGPVAADTTYVTTAETPQKRNLIVEEFTGASCPPCPPAREKLNNVAAQNPGRVFPIEMHINNYPQSKPAEGHKYDLRTDDGTSIGATIYGGVRAMPSAGVARTPVGGQLLLDDGQWAGTIANVLGTTTPVNMEVTSTYDATAHVATIRVKVAYTAAVAAKQYLSVAILEDNIVDVQEYADHYEDNYTFHHTLRDFITPIAGEEMLADVATKEAGRVYVRTYTYNVKEEWNADNCAVVAFVHNNDATSKEVIQAAEAKIKE